MNSDVTNSLHEARNWHLLARLFERPRPGWLDEVTTLAEGADADLREAASLARDATEGAYLSTLGPSGLVSPREVAHCGMRDPGQLLADLRTRYDAFGFRPALEDTIDHVAVEVDFVGYLRLKEAYARAQGDDVHATLSADAAAGFIDDHLTSMGEPMASKLADRAQAYLARAAAALVRRVGTPAPAASSRVIWMDDEDEMTCP